MARPIDLLSEQETHIAEQYRQRKEDYAQQAASLSQRLRVLVVCRAFVLGIAAALLLWAVLTSVSASVWFISALVLAAFWAGNMLAIGRVRKQLNYAQCLRDINDESIARMQRNWDRIPLTIPEVPDQFDGLVDDLDVFGKASLYHLVCQANTAWGVTTLRDWLLQPARDDLSDRQNAVAAMAGDLELRQELAARGRMLTTGPAGLNEFADWAESGISASFRLLLGWRIIYPIVVGVLVILFTADKMSSEFFGSALFFLLFVNLILSAVLFGSLHDTLRQIGMHDHDLYQYRRLFALATRSISMFPGLPRILDNGSKALNDTEKVLKSLHRILYFTPLLDFAVIWLPIQVVTLWDFHVYHYIEKWRRRHGTKVRVWLQAIGKLEAISSLAALAHDNPTWCSPKISSGPSEEIIAVGLAHPLQRDAARVPNDITLGPRGTVLFVTGSNMTGKSTLLRAIGLNIILGQAGGPVCAKQFQTPCVVLATTIRVRDSLERGISLYMSELLRLKQVIHQARILRENEDTIVLFLLDEILLGTNTAERHIAARAVILELIDLRAFGAVSTHDLELPKDSQLASICQNVHFSEQLVNRNGSLKLRFDYILRPGISKSTNAVRLLEAVGLRGPSSYESNQTNKEID